MSPKNDSPKARPQKRRSKKRKKARKPVKAVVTEAQAGEAVTAFRGRVKMFADDLAGRLRRAMRLTCPFTASTICPMKGGCAMLCRLLNAGLPGPGSLDLKTLAELRMVPGVVANFFAVSPNIRDAGTWLLEVVERINTDLEAKQRPTPELVRDLMEAATVFGGGTLSIPEADNAPQLVADTPSGFLDAADLAKKLNIPDKKMGALHMRLVNFRKKHGQDQNYVVCKDSPGPRESRYLHSLQKVRSTIENLGRQPN